MKCKECNGTGWVITKGRITEKSNATIQTRCPKCNYWIYNCDTLKYEKNPNYALDEEGVKK